jgi:hypothetical protein
VGITGHHCHALHSCTLVIVRALVRSSGSNEAVAVEAGSRWQPHPCRIQMQLLSTKDPGGGVDL